MDIDKDGGDGVYMFKPLKIDMRTRPLPPLKKFNKAVGEGAGIHMI